MTSRVRASILAITFAAFIAVPTLAAAQDPAHFGVRGGVNFAKLKFEDDSENDAAKSLTGFNAGVFVGKAISSNVGFRGELNFSQQGAKFEEGSDDGKVKLTYVNVPLLLTAGPASSGSTRFSVFTGPQIGFNTDAKLESGGVSVDFKDEVKSTDFSWVLGVGIENGNFMADARYALGLSGIAEDGDSVKNKVFSVNVGWRLK